jgi:hypothetical protein
MAILNKKLKEAEAIYLEQNQLDEALNMYQQFHKWDEGSVFGLMPENLYLLHYLCCKCYCLGQRGYVAIVGCTMYVPPLSCDTVGVGTDHCNSEEYRCAHFDMCVART